MSGSSENNHENNKSKESSEISDQREYFKRIRRVLGERLDDDDPITVYAGELLNDMDKEKIRTSFSMSGTLIDMVDFMVSISETPWDNRSEFARDFMTVGLIDVLNDSLNEIKIDSETGKAVKDIDMSQEELEYHKKIINGGRPLISLYLTVLDRLEGSEDKEDEKLREMFEKLSDTKD